MVFSDFFNRFVCLFFDKYLAIERYFFDFPSVLPIADIAESACETSDSYAGET